VQRVLRAALRKQPADDLLAERLHEAIGDALLRSSREEEECAPSARTSWLRSFAYAASPQASHALGYIDFCSSADDLLADGTGGTAWAAGVAAAELALSQPSLFAGKRVLELGCGVGLVGLALSRSATPPSHVLLTDGNAAAASNARRNLGVDGASSTEVIELAWEEVSAEFAASLAPQVILAADVIYDPTSISALCAALSHFLKQPAGELALVFVTPRQPASLALFLENCGAFGMMADDATEDFLPCGVLIPHLPALVEEERRRVRIYRLTAEPAPITFARSLSLFTVVEST
jgi:predicted nicotinamide N-methyase